MKIKVKQLILILPLIIISVFSCFALSSCSFSPSEIEFWYLESIVEDEIYYYTRSEECYKNELLSTDYLVFKFENDGSMTITHINGDVENGTFTEKRRGNSREITVNLENGVTLTGSCRKFAVLIGVQYSFYLSDGNVTYYLTENNAMPKSNQRAMFLKDAFPEIAELTVDEIIKINLSDFELTNKKFIEKFLNGYKTANFLKETYFGYPNYYSEYYSYQVTVFTQTSSYTLSMRVRSDCALTDICYENTYYTLRGDLAELLLSCLKIIN